MSDDLLRSARQFLAELAASEAYLRTLACQALPYRSVIVMERRAGRRCAELLAGLGGSVFDLDLGDDATDELLSGAVRPRATAAAAAAASGSASSGGLGSPELVGSADPFDDGPEGAADEVVDLLSEEDEPTGMVEERRPRAQSVQSPTEEEDTSDVDTSHGQQSPVKVSGDGDLSFVSFETGDQDEPEVLKYDDDGNVVAGDVERPGVEAATEASDDPFAGLVSFEDDSSEDEQDATLIVSREEAKAAAERLGDVGRDALDTIGQSSDSVIDSLGPSDDVSELELEELELDVESAHVETFDLMPDLTEDEDDDEAVTMVAPSPTEVTEDEPSSSEVVIDRAKRKPRAQGARVTAGLYGNPNVPTIRDSNEPRPRAAAIQLNAGGGGKVMGLEEEAEPIEIGEADEDELDDVPAGGGFSVTLEQYDDEDDYEEEEEDDEVIEPAPPLPQAPPPPSRAEIDGLFAQAREAAAGGDLQTGTDLFSDVIDLDPDHVDAHVGRGRLYLDLGDYSRAMSDFMVAEEIEESNPEPQIAIGDLYFARKDYRKAIDYFNAALEMSPNHAMAFCRRGISHYYRKNYKQALEDLLRAQKLNADIPNIQTYVSMAKKKAKR